MTLSIGESRLILSLYPLNGYAFLRETDSEPAADLLCDADLEWDWVTLAVAMNSDRDFDVYDVSMRVPPKLARDLVGDPRLDEIESALKELAGAEWICVNDFHCVPRIPSGSSFVPGDDFDVEGIDSNNVSAAWRKAAKRQATDPDGALTSARSLLEAVLKHILFKHKVTIDPAWKLPKLYHEATEYVGRRPGKQPSLALRKILGNCESIVGHIAKIRNDEGDAHGRSPDEALPCPHLAEYIVNIACSTAQYLIKVAEGQEAADDC